MGTQAAWEATEKQANIPARSQGQHYFWGLGGEEMSGLGVLDTQGKKKPQ